MKIKIDDHDLEIFEDDKNIVDVATRNKIPIPSIIPTANTQVSRDA